MTSWHHREQRRSHGERRDPGPACVPKLCGADIELGNFIVRAGVDGDTGAAAARALLGEIAGVPSDRLGMVASGYRSASSGGWAVLEPTRWNAQEVGRVFLANNGSSAYIDLSHLELCVPEVLSAYDHVAVWHAMLRIARAALTAANEKRPPGEAITVVVNNSDGHSHSWGSHCNFLIARRAWDNIFHRKIHHQLFLASCQVSSIVVTGQGKVGSENGAPPAPFQLSQRADFFETLTGEQTTTRRPLVNSRNESLCGSDGGGLARLHCIFFDSTLCHVATLLKIGIMQIVLAMIERDRIDARLILDDPLVAVRQWSHDPTLRARARLASGEAVTAVELQRRFLERAARFTAAGGCDGIVPRAAAIVELWGDTLEKLAAGDFPALTGRLDWVLKRQILERALHRRPDLHWGSPVIKHLDLLYGSLDASEGLYWAHEREGVVEPVVDDHRIAHFVENAPDDTRAWTRALLLRVAGEHAVRVDWDSITFEFGAPSDRRRVVFDLANPLRFTRREVARRCRRASSLHQVLAAFGAAGRAAGTQLARAIAESPCSVQAAAMPRDVFGGRRDSDGRAARRRRRGGEVGCRPPAGADGAALSRVRRNRL